MTKVVIEDIIDIVISLCGKNPIAKKVCTDIFDKIIPLKDKPLKELSKRIVTDLFK